MDFQQLAEELVRTIRSLNKSSFVMDLNRYAKGEMLVLNYLYQHREELIVPGDISNFTGTSSARIATILGSLEEQGYLTREIDRTDRRKILVAITEKGESVARTHHDFMLNRLASVLEYMGENESQQFLQSIKTFVEAGKLVLQKQEMEKEKENA